ncbi:MAG: hypothetical protein FWG87_09210 [Defluviitaleaceae bacterium]|nr:hypothetical protein [Defluviitaleaceae bacterium]
MTNVHTSGRINPPPTTPYVNTVRQPNADLADLRGFERTERIFVDFREFYNEPIRVNP